MLEASDGGFANRFQAVIDADTVSATPIEIPQQLRLVTVLRDVRRLILDHPSNTFGDPFRDLLSSGQAYATISTLLTRCDKDRSSTSLVEHRRRCFNGKSMAFKLLP
ncbi:MAG: hypothetical protein NTW75_06940 [Planctomycetales bacterium]|nr:hypothetical protein [Planctomycetales bacterium]